MCFHLGSNSIRRKNLHALAELKTPTVEYGTDYYVNRCSAKITLARYDFNILTELIMHRINQLSVELKFDRCFWSVEHLEDAFGVGAELAR